MLWFYVCCHREHLHREKNFVNINFIISLILALSFFLIGLDNAYSEVSVHLHLHLDDGYITAAFIQTVCKLMAVVMHYLFLSVFFWMLCNGILLYLMVVVIFTTRSNHYKQFLLMGWGNATHVSKC